MMNHKNHLILIMVTAFFLSCGKDDESGFPDDYSKGIYIINEGTFGYNNGSISYMDPLSGKIINNIFETANDGRVVGDVVQSMVVIQDTLGYIVVNGKSKVEVVDLRTFKTLTGPILVDYPRYCMQVNSSKGYLTRGCNQGYVQIINLISHLITDSIEVGFGPENMALLDDLVYVANSGGGWLVDSTISVINVAGDAVVDTINVGKVPVDLAFDADNNLWVYCKGYAQYGGPPNYELISETDAMIQRINPSTKQILWQGKVGKAGDYIVNPGIAISSNSESIYFLRPDGIYMINVLSPAMPVSPLIAGTFYGFDVHPGDGNLFAFEASFTGNGLVKVFSSNGEWISEGVVGILPKGAVFHIN